MEEGYMWRRVVLGIILLILAPSINTVQGAGASTAQTVVNLPQGPITRLASPDHKWTLIFECPNDCAERKLWIEASTSHTRRLVNEYERSLDISWAPDSHSFFVNDEFGSNGTLCYVYDPIALKVQEVAAMLTSGDTDATMFIRAGHSYLKAKQWINSQELLVVLYGHFDDPPARGFTIRYRVSLTGRVQKLSQRSQEVPQ